MLTVETIGRIRREHLLKGKTIKEIARDLKVSRNTVRRVLRSGATSFEYEREVQPRPKLGRWTAELVELLTSNAAKAAREQLTLIRVFEELRGRGYDGGYDAVRRYARRWAKERGQSTAAAYVPLSFAPGEAYQFDWSHEVVLLSGVTVIVKAAHVRLCHSRMMFVRVYPRETQEMVFDAHDRAFALFKGACGRGIYDNMKTAVETIFVGKQRLYNRRFLQMCSHYLVDPVACTPASGWEKGQVENQVGLIRERGCSINASPTPSRQDGRIVAEHPRSFGRGDTVYDPWHYVPVLARKPGGNFVPAPPRTAAKPRPPQATSASTSSPRLVCCTIAHPHVTA
jgi:transposase